MQINRQFSGTIFTFCFLIFTNSLVMTATNSLLKILWPTNSSECGKSQNSLCEFDWRFTLTRFHSLVSQWMLVVTLISWILKHHFKNEYLNSRYFFNSVDFFNTLFLCSAQYFWSQINFHWHKHMIVVKFICQIFVHSRRGSRPHLWCGISTGDTCLRSEGSHRRDWSLPICCWKTLW